MTKTADAAQALLPALQAYLDYLAGQRRASPHTLDNYRRDLWRLQTGAAGRDLATLQTHDIRRLLARMHAEGLAPRSLARTLSAWRGLYRWLLRNGTVDNNPVISVRPPRAPKTLPKVLSPDQAAALLNAAPDTVLHTRDLAMFELFYSSGLRLAELAGLDVAGLHQVADGEVTVLGKRNKTRVVPVGAQALNALAQWRTQRACIAAPSEPALFVSQRGQRLSVSAIRQRLAQWAQKQGLPMHVHPHMLRHSFASHVLQSSGDLRAVQELLGHASIRSTQVYTHLDFQHLAKVYDAAHPRARKTTGDKD